MKTSSLPDWAAALRGWATRQPKLSIAAGTAALLIAGWAAYAPSVLAIRRAGTHCGELTAEMREVRRLMDLVRSGQVRLLPSQESLPALLQELQVRARECKVNVLEISPGKANSADASGPLSLPIEMQMEGEYRSLGEFLGKLRTEPSLGVVTVRSLRIGRDERLLPRLRAQLSIELALRQGAENGS